VGHTYANLLIHVVFSTKNRRAAIKEAWRQRLYEYMAGIARHEFGRALSLGGTDNHLHGLLSVQPSVALSDAMRKWKSLSSGWVHQTIPAAPGFAWQAGYAAFSVSESNAHRVVRYIETQDEHHRTRSFEDELLALLARHRVSFDTSRL